MSANIKSKFYGKVTGFTTRDPQRNHAKATGGKKVDSQKAGVNQQIVMQNGKAVKARWLVIE